VRTLKLILFAVLGFAIAGLAKAEGTPLLPGTFGPPLPTGFGQTSLLDSGSSAFSSGGLAGTLFWQVWSNSANSLLAGNEFAYRFDVTGTEAVHRMTINNWDSALTNVGFSPLLPSPPPLPPTLGTQPTTADRSLSGSTIGWDFAGSVQPGTSSTWLVVFTDGTTISPAVASFIDGASVSVGTVALIPEPETYAMLLAGMGMIGFIARRRKRALAA
jgi:PEP-CTERM motif